MVPWGLNEPELLQAIAELLQAIAGPDAIAELLQALAAGNLAILDPDFLQALAATKWIGKFICSRLLRLKVPTVAELVLAAVSGGDIVRLPMVPYRRYSTLLRPCEPFLLFLDADRLSHLQWFRIQSLRYHSCSLKLMHDGPGPIPPDWYCA